MDKKNEAQEYARRIADEIRALDVALEGGEGAADALKSLEMEDRDDAEGDWFGLWLNETALDLSVKVDVRGYARGGASVEVLRTCGGPRCEITWDSNDGANVEVRVWDGPDFGRVRLTLDNLAARFEELVSEMAGV